MNISTWERPSRRVGSALRTLTTAIMKLPIPGARRGHVCHSLPCKLSALLNAYCQAQGGCHFSPQCTLPGYCNCSSLQIRCQYVQNGLLACLLAFFIKRATLSYNKIPGEPTDSSGNGSLVWGSMERTLGGFYDLPENLCQLAYVC